VTLICSKFDRPLLTLLGKLTSKRGKMLFTQKGQLTSEKSRLFIVKAWVDDKTP